METRNQGVNSMTSTPKKKRKRNLKGLTIDSTYAHVTLSTNVLRGDLLAFLEEWVEDTSEFQKMNRKDLATQVLRVQEEYRQRQVRTTTNVFPAQNIQQAAHKAPMDAISSNKQSSSANETDIGSSSAAQHQVNDDNLDRSFDQNLAGLGEDSLVEYMGGFFVNPRDTALADPYDEYLQYNDSPANEAEEGLVDFDEEVSDLEKARHYLEILVEIARNDLFDADNDVMEVDYEQFEGFFDHVHDRLSRSNVEDIIRLMVEQEQILDESNEHLDMDRWTDLDQYNFKIMSKLVEVLRENVAWHAGRLPFDEALDLIESLFPFWRGVKIGNKPLVLGRVSWNSSYTNA